MKNLLRGAYMPDYVLCALWATTDYEGTPLDEGLSPHEMPDVAPEWLQAQRDDIAGFLWHTRRVIRALRKLRPDCTPQQIAHDFWLTREHHGAGFWDRGYGEAGTRLTAMAHTFSSSADELIDAVMALEETQ